MTDVRAPNHRAVRWHRARRHRIIENHAAYEPPWFRCDDCDIEWRDVQVAFAAARLRDQQMRLRFPHENHLYLELLACPVCNPGGEP